MCTLTTKSITALIIAMIILVPLTGCQRTPSEVNVPDVVGMTQSAAESALTGAGLSVGTVTEQYSDTVPTGQVISQNPTAGTSVTPGSSVALVVSKGPEPINVPDVVGMTQSAAESALTDAGLSVGTVTEQYSDSVPVGQVISQDPAAGTSVAPNSAVALVMSKGHVLESDSDGFAQSQETEDMYLESGAVVQAAKDELLLSLKPDITRQELDALLQHMTNLNIEVIGDDSELRMLQVRIPETKSEKDLIADLEEQTGVVSVNLNLMFQIDEQVRQDNWSMFQEYLDRVKQIDRLVEQERMAASEVNMCLKRDSLPGSFDGDYWIDQINCREAWDISTGSSAVTIGIVDSGFNPSENSINASRLEQIDRNGNVIHGDSGGTNGSDTHGTLTTTFAAGDGGIDDGFVGVCWNAHLLHVDAIATDVLRTFASLAQHIRAAVTRTPDRPVVVNVSMSGLLDASSPATNAAFLEVSRHFRETMTSTVEAARRNNVLVCFSAGNDGAGYDANHPRRYDSDGNPIITVHNDNQYFRDESTTSDKSWKTNSLIVAATTEEALAETAPINSTERVTGKMAEFSRQGAVVNIAAPGHDMQCSNGWNTGFWSWLIELITGPDLVSGTSFSAPLVTGVAGLVAGINPILSAPEIRQIILETANPEPLAGASVGSGLLDAQAACQSAQASLEVQAGEPIDITFSSSDPGPFSRQFDITAPGGGSKTTSLAIDVMFLIDTSGSYYDDIETLKAASDQILTDLTALGTNVQFGVASFSDFPFDPYGDSTEGDEAFVLDQRITDNTSLVLNAIDMLNQPLNYGADTPESQLEAVYQTVTGAGRDLNEDGDYDDLGEIRPANIGWRAGALRVIILATDAWFHDSDVEPDYPGAGFGQVIAELDAHGVTIVGLDSGDTESDLLRLVESTNGLMYELASDSSGIGQAILEAVEDIVREFDLSLTIVGDPEEFVVRDSLETFDSVAAGESRTFTVEFENPLNVPVQDLNYEFVIWVRADGSAILKRVPVSVAVKSK